jgi:Fe-S oxidoreductases
MLFGQIAYGPIHSRRLGTSLGMEIMPLEHKLCTFNCVYCECGWNESVSHPQLPSRKEVYEALEAKLQALRKEDIHLDVITFSGNGEPTLHPDFLGIIEDTCALRDRYYPTAKVSVLSNSTQLGREDVVQALKRCDNRILKLDAGTDEMMRRIDLPVNSSLTVETIVGWLQQFSGDFVLQTCFLRGEHNGLTIDNTTKEELQAWYQAVDRLQPKQIMIYVIDRKTPEESLEKISREQMEQIAAPLIQKGFDVSISA